MKIILFLFLVSLLVLLASTVYTPTKLITQFHASIMKTVHACSFDHPIFLQCGDDQVYATPVDSVQIYQECLEEVIVCRVSAFGGLECWTGVLEWSTGMESLDWSEALEWACDHFWESFRHFSTMVLSLIGEYEEGLKP